MIIDIIPMPIKIPPNEDVDMDYPLWIETMDGGEDVTPVSRNFVSCSDAIHRYKIIDACPGAIIETIVCSVGLEGDVLNPANLLKVSGNGPVQLIPITTKIHTMSPTGIKTSAYRHLSGIKTLIAEHESIPLQSAARNNYALGNDDLLSVHQLFLAAIAASMYEFNRMDYGTALIAFATRNRARLQSLISAHEEDNCTLISHIHSLSTHYVAEIFDTEDNFVSMIETMSQLPKVHKHDTITRLACDHGYLDSSWLRPHLSPEYARRAYCATTPASDIHDISKSAYSPPCDLGSYVSPILNMLELMPFTDISISFTFGEQAKINYAHSVFGYVQPAQNVVSKNLFDVDRYGRDGAVRHMGTVSLLNMGLAVESFAIAACSLYNNVNSPYGVSPRFKVPLEQLECKIAKTFCEEVYIELTSRDRRLHLLYYFDLTMYALGTKGLMDVRMINSFVRPSEKFWQYLNQVYPLH